MGNFYFEKEDGLWKIDMAQTLIDLIKRVFAAPEVQEFMEAWKKGFEEMDEQLNNF